MMKRIFTKGILLLALCLAASTALAAEAQSNPAYNDTSMVTVDGKQMEIDSPAELVGAGGFLGFAFLQPSQWSQLKDETLASLNQTEEYVYVDYLPQAHKELLEQMARTANDEEWEKLYGQVQKNSLHVLCLFRVHPDEAATLETEASLRKQYQHVDVVAQSGRELFYLGYNGQFDGTALSPDDQADLATLAAGREAISQSLMIFPKVEFEEMEEGGYEEPDLVCDLSSFTAQDLEGNAFTQADLARYDLTMINIWATYCGPCLQEMGDLAKLKGMLPDNANMITICMCCGISTPLNASAAARASGPAPGTPFIPASASGMRLLGRRARCRKPPSLNRTNFLSPYKGGRRHDEPGKNDGGG